MKKLRSEHIQIGTGTGNDDEEGNGNYIYMNEVLIPTSKNVLKEGRQRERGKNHSFKGYTMNGQVRVGKSETSEATIIESFEDIGNIV